MASTIAEVFLDRSRYLFNIYFVSRASWVGRRIRRRDDDNCNRAIACVSVVLWTRSRTAGVSNLRVVLYLDIRVALAGRKQRSSSVFRHVATSRKRDCYELSRVEYFRLVQVCASSESRPTRVSC